MVRQRSPAKPKIATPRNGLPRGKSTPSGAAPNKTLASDFSFYPRIFLLIIVIMGFSGFLLYPDILSVIRTVQEKMSMNLYSASDVSDTPVVHQESKREIDDSPSAVLKFDKHDIAGNDDSARIEEKVKADLMEDEELEMKKSKVPDQNTDDMNVKEETESDDKTAKTKKIKKTDSTKTVNKKKTSDSQNSKTDTEAKIPPRRPGSKTDPIILSSENNEIVLDPSQIRIADSEDESLKERKPPKSSAKADKKSDEDTSQPTKGAAQSPKAKKQKDVDTNSGTGTGNKQESGPSSGSGNSKRENANSPNKATNKKVALENNQNTRSDSAGTISPRKPGSKQGPIVLNAENNEIFLDPSQIKIVDSGQESPKGDKNVNLEEASSKGKPGKKSSTKTNEKSNDGKQRKKNSQKNSSKSATSDETTEEDEIKNFKPTYHKTFTPKKIFAGGRRIPPVELLHQKESNSSVRVFLFNDFLSEQECDGLIKAHDKHVASMDKPPILCFDSINTLQRHLKDAKKKIKVTPNVFTEGTRCVNASFSRQLQSWLKANWSYSTVFYPGESKFSTAIGYRIQQAMGLDPSSGGKFQITSYPVGKAYKAHHDCLVDGIDERDRVASVLMYLNDVEEGGETAFPELGIWVKPKKGRALVWNNMSPEGKCEPDSRHVASVVKQGSKYILIRWYAPSTPNTSTGYYYKTFYSLGKRPPPPPLPQREENQPMVSCDVYGSGSCRWYDEWSYEPLLEYHKQKLTLI